MAASRTSRTRLVLPLMILMTMIIAALGLGLLNLASNLPDLNDHALARHQAQAQLAYNHVQSLGAQADHCKWSCNDGRDRYVCGMDDGKWAIVIIEGAELVTSFVASQDYARSIIDTPGCKNPWHYSHP